MDPITDIFTAMRIESLVYRRLELTAPWGLRIEKGVHACFGMIARGNCWLAIEGEPKPIPLTGGDCFCLFAQDRAHTLRDHPRTRAHCIREVIEAATGDAVHFGGGGVPTTIIGGKFTFDKINSKPLTDLLPPLVHVRADRAQTTPLEQTLQLLAAEAAQPSVGSELVLKRLADVLLIQVIRAHVASGACTKTGWLRGLSDQQISAALLSMHERIEQPWTVAGLASAAGMSRSAFALRFKEIVGETPLEYLTRWRIYKAAMLLREGRQKLIEVANSIGYSDAAFNKTFKRIMGATPGEYRRNGAMLPSD
ncbi:MAG: AraC family transcriptional regulator [Bryobacteraceae bacterium]